MDTRALNCRSWIKEGHSSKKRLGGYFRGDGCITHLPERSEEEEEWTGWTKYSFPAMSEFYFRWGPGPVTCFGHSQPSILQHLGGPSPFSHSQAGHKALWYQQPLLSTWLASRRGNLAASPCCKQMGQKEKKGKEKVPTGRVCCFHRAGGSRARLDYNPCYVFISALFTRCCSLWLTLFAAARFIITSPGKLCHLVKQTHENDAAVTAFQC